MNWIRLGAINALILVLLTLVLEMGLRVAWTVRSCVYKSCDFGRVTTLKVRRDTTDKEFRVKFIGMSRYDENLGYVPTENFNQIINWYDWINKRVTIDDDGFRINGDNDDAFRRTILAVGDSFTFGDQVSNDETWPSCLQQKSGRGVANAGVSGYGPAQALRRAQLELKKNKYSELILSVLVIDSEFERDRLQYRVGVASPALIKNESNISWSDMPDMNRFGTIYNPSQPNKNLRFFYGRSLILAIFFDRLVPRYNFSGDQLTIVHPNAADLDDVIHWTLSEFAGVEGPRKILMLQYVEDMSNKTILELRNKLLKISEKLSLKVVDTYDHLKVGEAKKIWFGHHTPLGNRMVCEYLYEKAFRNIGSGL